MFPFSVPFPTFIVRPIRAFLVFARVLPRPINWTKVPKIAFPFNFVTAPLVSVLFLLAIEAIGHEEVKNGIIGANGHVQTQKLEYLLILLLPGSSLLISWRSSLPWLVPCLCGECLY